MIRHQSSPQGVAERTRHVRHAPKIHRHFPTLTQSRFDFCESECVGDIAVRKDNSPVIYRRE